MTERHSPFCLSNPLQDQNSPGVRSEGTSVGLARGLLETGVCVCVYVSGSGSGSGSG